MGAQQRAFRELIRLHHRPSDLSVMALGVMEEEREERYMGPTADLTGMMIEDHHEGEGRFDISTLGDAADRFITEQARPFVEAARQARHRYEQMVGQPPHQRSCPLGHATTFLRSMRTRAEEIIEDIESPALRRQLMSRLTGVEAV